MASVERTPRPSRASAERAAEAVERFKAANPKATPLPAPGGPAEGSLLEKRLARFRETAEARGFVEEKEPQQAGLFAKAGGLRLAPAAPKPEPPAQGTPRDPNPVARLAYAAVIAGDSGLPPAARLLLTSILWRYRPGRALTVVPRELAEIHGMHTKSVFRCLRQAEERGHIVRLKARRGPPRIVFPVVEEKTGGLDWVPAQQLELPGFEIESSDPSAVSFFVPNG